MQTTPLLLLELRSIRPFRLPPAVHFPHPWGLVVGIVPATAVLSVFLVPQARAPRVPGAPEPCVLCRLSVLSPPPPPADAEGLTLFPAARRGSGECGVALRGEFRFVPARGADVGGVAVGEAVAAAQRWGGDLVLGLELVVIEWSAQGAITALELLSPREDQGALAATLEGLPRRELLACVAEICQCQTLTVWAGIRAREEIFAGCPPAVLRHILLALEGGGDDGADAAGLVWNLFDVPNLGLSPDVIARIGAAAVSVIQASRDRVDVVGLYLGMLWNLPVSAAGAAALGGVEGLVPLVAELAMGGERRQALCCIHVLACILRLAPSTVPPAAEARLLAAAELFLGLGVVPSANAVGVRLSVRDVVDFVLPLLVSPHPPLVAFGKWLLAVTFPTPPPPTPAVAQLLPP